MELHYDEIGYPRLRVKTKEGKDLTFEPNNVCFMGWAIDKKTSKESYQIYVAPYEESDYELFELFTKNIYGDTKEDEQDE